MAERTRTEPIVGRAMSMLDDESGGTRLWMATCSCGWRSPVEYHRSEARYAFDKHVCFAPKEPTDA